jgi:DNA polymerase-3 subunit gamma/tau
MSEVLYRKYRPHTFKEVIGQDHVVQVLQSQVASKHISHAYLFAGTRGTGKTSVARIFAQAIGATTNDIYEIDSASNNSVDEMRVLNESVHTLPFNSPYKVYILDEVHMLSKSASNALLKTLEEPPAHVVFILATTETHKIPETVLSRCQTFVFKKPTPEVLQKVVKRVATEEGYTLDDASVELIALLGDGSFRDTHGILQKVISYAEGTVQSKKKSGPVAIGYDDVQVVTGAPSVTLVTDLVTAVATADTAQALQIVATASGQNIDMKVFITLILHMMRAVLLIKSKAGKVIADHLSIAQYASAERIASLTPGITSALLVEFLTAYERTGSAQIASLPLELAVLSVAKK